MTEASSFAGTTRNPDAGPPIWEMARLSSYAEVTEVLKSRDFVPTHGYRDNAAFLGGSLLALAGDDHFARRRIEAALFRPQAMQRLEAEVFGPALDEDLAAWPRDADGRVRGDLMQLMRRVLSRLSIAVVGLDGVDGEEARERHMLYTAKISAGVNLEFAVRDHREVASECLAYVEKFRDEFFLPSWRRRQALVERFQAGAIARDAVPVDLLTLMLLHREHFAAYGEEAPLREAILFNGASGGVTIAACNTLTHLLNWVEKDPAARRPLLDDPGFLRRAAFEAMRMRPATPFQIRKTIKTATLSSGRTIAEGEFIALAMGEASRDRTVFGEDADNYDPMRKPVGRVKPAGIAFSEGPHTCIAMSLSVGDANSDDEERHGLLIALLSQLLRRDVRIEAGDGVKRQDGTIRAEFDAFTVTLAAPR